MNKKETRDYNMGALLICSLFIVGLFLDLVTPFMLLVINLALLRFVVLSRRKS